MTLYEELRARGLIAQVTNEQEISEMINNGKATFYIGFDPTADRRQARSNGPKADAAGATRRYRGGGRTIRRRAPPPLFRRAARNV